MKFYLIFLVKIKILNLAEEREREGEKKRERMKFPHPFHLSFFFVQLFWLKVISQTIPES